MNLRITRVVTNSRGFGEHTLECGDKPIIWIYGANGSGKGTFFEVVRAALLCKVWSDRKGSFTKVAANNSADLGEAFCADGEDLVSQVVTTMGTGTFDITHNPRSGKASAVAEGFKVPRQSDLHEEMETLFKRKGKLFNEGLADYVLEGVTEELLLEALEEIHHEKWKELAKGNTPAANKLVRTIAKVEEQIKSGEARLKQFEATAQEGLAPVDAAEVAAMEARVMHLRRSIGLLQQWATYETALKAQAEATQWVQATRAVIDEQQQRLDSLSIAYSNKISLLTKSVDSLEGAFKAASAKSCDVGNCPTCWGTVDPEALKALLLQQKQMLSVATQERAADPQVRELAAWIQSAEAQVREKQRSLGRIIPPTDAKPLEARDQLEREMQATQPALGDLLTAKSRWDAEQMRRDGCAELEASLMSLRAFLKALLQVRTTVITAKKKGFSARVSALLPASIGESVFIDNERARVGVVRDGAKLTDLSGGEWAVLMGAFAIAAGEQRPVPPPVFLPDRTYHALLLSQAAALWAGYPGVILMQSGYGPATLAPSLRPPAATTCVLSAEEIFRQVVPDGGATQEETSETPKPAPKKSKRSKAKSEPAADAVFEELAQPMGLKLLDIGAKVRVLQTVTVPGSTAKAENEIEGTVLKFNKAGFIVKLGRRRITFTREGVPVSTDLALRITHWCSPDGEETRDDLLQRLTTYLQPTQSQLNVAMRATNGELHIWLQDMLDFPMFCKIFRYTEGTETPSFDEPAAPSPAPVPSLDEAYSPMQDPPLPGAQLTMFPEPPPAPSEGVAVAPPPSFV